MAPSSEEKPGPSSTSEEPVAVSSQTDEAMEVEEKEESAESENAAKNCETPVDKVASNVQESPNDEVKPEERTKEPHQLNRSEQNEEKDLEKKYQEALDLLPHLDSKCLTDLISKASVLLAKKL